MGAKLILSLLVILLGVGMMAGFIPSDRVFVGLDFVLAGVAIIVP